MTHSIRWRRSIARLAQARWLAAFTASACAIVMAISCASEEDKELCAAIESHDVDAVKQLLADGTHDLNARQGATGTGCRPFVEAIGAVPSERLSKDRRPFEIVQLMVDAGADPNGCWAVGTARTITGTRRTPSTPGRRLCVLELSANQQSPELVRYMLSKGANARGGAGATALVSAASSGDLDLVKILIDAGAPLNDVPPSNGDHGSDRTALGAAVDQFQDEVVRYLEAIPEAREFPLPGAATGVGSALSSAAGTMGWLNANEQAFMTAARRGDVDSIKRLRGAGVSVDRIDDVGMTALMRASAWGHVAAADVLLAAGASLATVRDGLTALHFAAKRGHSDVIRRLVSANANVNERYDDTSDTPLLSAVKAGQAGAVRTLIDLGADPNVSELSMTALEYAVWLANTAVVRELLKDGRADVNARHPSSKESPLHGALWCKNRDYNVELIQTLVAAGADLAAKDAEGDTPLQAVEKKRAKESLPYYQACYDAQLQTLRAHVR